MHLSLDPDTLDLLKGLGVLLGTTVATALLMLRERQRKRKTKPPKSGGGEGT